MPTGCHFELPSRAMLTEVLRDETRAQHTQLETANPLPHGSADYGHTNPENFGRSMKW